jgi:hypothetical protein
MKKLISLLLLGLALHLSGQKIGNGKVVGSGTIITEERPLSNFTNIQVEGCYNVIITQDTFQKVMIKTDDNIMPDVKTEVSGGKLRIFFSDRYRNYEPTSITVYISSSLIEDIGLAGSGTIRSTNQLKSKSPHYKISGSGNINLSVVAGTIETAISGSGNIDLKGSASSAKHGISGSGNVNALNLISTDVEVKISGSGNCFINAATSLDVNINGSGTVQYKGTPQTHISGNGSGKVKKY